MAKEKNFNPVQAQHKADKAKAIKKGKASVAAARNERLAKKNPERIQVQIDELKAVTDGGGKLTRHEEQLLEGLEKEFRAVKKAREALGDQAPAFGRGGGQAPHGGHGHRGILGKRGRGDGNDSSDDDKDIPEDVRRIPMPGDTPPPIPKAVLDDWYAKRRARRDANKDANREPLGEGRGGGRGEGRGESYKGGQAEGRNETTKAPAAVPARTVAPKPAVGKTVYEAKPIVRDLQKEAVTAFMPTVVRRKIEKGQGKGGLLEPEEADRLEKEGYLRSYGEGSGESGVKEKPKNAKEGSNSKPPQPHPSTGLPELLSGPRRVTVEDVDDDEDDG